MHNSGKSRREIAEACREYERATLTIVIVRESGRSSIPETAVMESRSRGVLDAPVKPGHDGSLCSSTNAPHSQVVIARLDRAIQYSRDAYDGIETPRRTGYPAGACHRARRRRDPVGGHDGRNDTGTKYFPCHRILLSAPNVYRPRRDDPASQTQPWRE